MPRRALFAIVERADQAFSRLGERIPAFQVLEYIGQSRRAEDRHADVLEGFGVMERVDRPDLGMRHGRLLRTSPRPNLAALERTTGEAGLFRNQRWAPTDRPERGTSGWHVAGRASPRSRWRIPLAWRRVLPPGRPAGVDDPLRRRSPATRPSHH